MITIKTEKDIVLLREGGRRLARILAAVAAEVRPGISTAALNELAEKLISAPDTSAFLGYKPKGAPRPYPASLCVSINDEVVHGIPNESPRIVADGDVVSLDLGLIHQGLITDHAVTVGAGTLKPEAEQLLAVTKKALEVGIAAAQAGKKTGDIGWAIQSYVLNQTKPSGRAYGIVEELAGHGVGYSVHEDPFVPNFGKPNQGALLKPGMVIAIEPMLTLGGPDITIDPDGYTVRTADASLAAHFEHTILITETGPQILTTV
jgi:methionyl aminopeptidase